jgi:type I restriction enzyme, S subunit
MIFKTKKLSDICTIVRGASPRPIKRYITTSSDGFNWIKISDATASNKYIFKTRQKIKKEGAPLSRIVKVNDLILSNSMSFGRPYIMKTTGCVHDGWLLLTDYQSELDMEYFYYLLSSPQVIKQFEKSAVGSTVRNLNIALVKDVEISFPSLHEQKRIVAEISKVLMGISKIADIELQKKEETKLLVEKINDSIFNKLKNKSKSIKLSSIIKFENGDRGKNYPSKKYQLSVGIPFINAGDLSLDGEITQKGMVYLSDDRFNLLGAGKIELDDILFCLRGSLGKCALNKTYKKGAIASSLVIMRPDKKKILPKYLLAYLKSGLIKKYIKNTASGTAQPNLSAKTVCNYEIPLPSIEIQKLVLNKIENIKEEYFKLRKIISQKRDELEKLKSSLLLEKLSDKAA